MHLKNMFNGFIRLDVAEKRISKLEDSLIESSRTKQQRLKKGTEYPKNAGRICNRKLEEKKDKQKKYLK